MNRYAEYIEKILHINADVSIYTNCDKLPLYLRNCYYLYTLSIQNVRCLLAQPKEVFNLTVLRKQCDQLKKLTGLDCVLCLESVRIYTKEKMLSEGIPFIIAGQQIYMPFLGIALTQNGMREITRTNQLSFVTQVLLLTSIYQNWTRKTLTEAAKILGVSKMTVTRCFDELQGLGLLLIKSERKMRRFIWEESCRILWETVRPFLRNPVSVQYHFSGNIDIGTAKLGGISAICHYSMLSDNSFMIYAVSKDAAKTLELNKLPQIPEDETPDIVVQVMRYEIEYQDNIAIDPLTAILSLTDDEKADPRMEAAIEQILEDNLYV